MTAADAKPIRDEAANAIKQASRAAKQGNRELAQHWTSLAEKLTATAQKLATVPEPIPDAIQHEEVTAELRRRLAKIAEMDNGVTRWEMQREMWLEMSAVADRTGCPHPPALPPRPRNWIDDLPEEVQRRFQEQAENGV